MGKTVSGAIATLLLFLYAFAVVRLLRGAMSPQLETVLGLVGGLVSALVVAVLAVTPSDSSPARIFAEDSDIDRRLQAIVWSYLVVWLACGVALLAGWLLSDSPSEPLNAAATSWLGLAVAAAYSYLGIKPPSQPAK